MHVTCHWVEWEPGGVRGNWGGAKEREREESTGGWAHGGCHPMGTLSQAGEVYSAWQSLCLQWSQPPGRGSSLIFPPLKESMFVLNDPPATRMGLPKGSQTRARLSL